MSRSVSRRRSGRPQVATPLAPVVTAVLRAHQAGAVALVAGELAEHPRSAAAVAGWAVPQRAVAFLAVHEVPLSHAAQRGRLRRNLSGGY